MVESVAYNRPLLLEGSRVVSNVKRLVCGFGLVLVAVGAVGDSVPAGTVADIEDRTRPFGELCLEGDDCGGVGDAPPAVQVVERTGSEIYAKHCQVCHLGGLNNAPKFGDAEAWEPRLAKGMDELFRNTKEGFNNGLMPAMGTCMDCTDAELRAALEYTVGASGDDG
ncbi:MAG: cytochrome c5 family protein [Gammaproteobacteria bacterium]|nr:cytochrome c5 family protein [Gammaproteobacteria bacterium]